MKWLVDPTSGEYHGHVERADLMTAHRYAALLAALLAVSPMACLRGGHGGHPNAATSQPVAATAPGASSSIHLDGVPAFAQVSEHLYRGGQPLAAGFAELKGMGVKTVVSLRVLGSDRHRLSGTGLRYLQLRVNPLHPEEEDVVAFLQVACDPRNQPVFVHCRQGVDRTGMMVAAYRMVVEGWPREKAMAEMRSMGFNGGWDLMEDYLDRLDVRKIRARLASTRPPRVEIIR